MPVYGRRSFLAFMFRARVYVPARERAWDGGGGGGGDDDDEGEELARDFY